MNLVFVALILSSAIADPETPASVAPLPAPVSTSKSPLIQIPSQRVPVKTAKRGPRREQKETEGTEAPERFEADTILKSPYSVDGQPLEVDPD